MKRLPRYLLAVLACALALPALAGECKPVLKNGWISLPPIPAPTVLAGYGTLANPCAKAAIVVGAESPVFERTMLHASTVVDGVSRMRSLGELPIAAKGSVTFAPGGQHLMLLQPSAPLREGDRVAVAFKLKDGGEIIGELAVRKAMP
ncbi:MAG: copper chaperone PCu(A)C [Pseudoxanthomonas sp.]